MPQGDEQLPEVIPARVIQIEATLAGKLNLADFQNAVPLVRDLRVINGLVDRFTNLELTLRAEPAFIQSKTWVLDQLGGGDRVQLTHLDVVLDGTLFLRLTEAEQASVTFTLKAKGTDESLAEQRFPVELLPRNQWGGVGHLPEMLAAFAQPNDPGVDRVLKQAAGILTRGKKDSSLDGYKGGPKRAWEIASAIWGAFTALQLDYALPPASFEFTGQKVRSPTQVLDSGLATCLDLALFCCAACEQAGLHPILVITRGHAFAGVWLRSEEFSTVLVDDITALRKRVKLNELVLFETTLLTHRGTPPFSFATEKGLNQISEAEGDAFEFAIDIHRARMHRIKPLASADPIGYAKGAAVEVIASEPILEEAPDLPEDPEPPEIPSADLDPKDRLTRWQRKLLDLSLRNNLLNFREGKKSIRLNAPDPGALEDLLAAGESFKLLPMPDLMEGRDPRDQAIHESRDMENVRRGLALDALARKEIFVSLPQDDMEIRLVEQFRTARGNLQEGGANTLFLAMGFLTWTRPDKPTQRLKAPLILIPVTLNRRSVRSGFTLCVHEDEPRFNPTLLEMLRQDFSLNLGIQEGELPTDESGLDIQGIWKTVSQAIKDIRGWEVTEELILALFSFSKHLMWKDLTERTDKLRENPVVRHLIDTPRESFPSPMPFPDPRRLDREFGPERTFCPLQADSSQLSAVLAASRGKDFVLIGPPGTGKSQTIANLIAQCLAEGKKVLFVAEKIAALDVVHRRLRDVGLGEFCLEIHSNKARKVDMLSKLQQAWEARGELDTAAWKAEAERIRVLREQLNTYVERMHHVHLNGLTLHGAIGLIVGGSANPKLGLAWPHMASHGLEDLEQLRGLVDRLAANAQAMVPDNVGNHPLSHVQATDWSPAWQRRLLSTAQALSQQCEALEQGYARLAVAIGLPALSLTGPARDGLGLLLQALPQAYGRDWRFALRPEAPKLAVGLRRGLELLAQHRALTQSLSPGWSDLHRRDCEAGLAHIAERQTILDTLGPRYSLDMVEQLRKGLSLLESAAQAEAALSVPYTDAVEQLDIFQLQRDWVRAEASIWPISWWRKKQVTQKLEGVAQGLVDAARDVHTLAKLRSFQHKLATLEVDTLTDNLWKGRGTNLQNLQAVLSLQTALSALLEGHPWEDRGLERIAEARCGERLQRQLTQLRRIAVLDADLARLDHLGEATEGLWKGLATCTPHLQAALRLLTCMDPVRKAGTLCEEHPFVQSGACGEILAQDLRTMRARAQTESSLAELASLGQETAGLWASLDTDISEVHRALAFTDLVGRALPLLAPTREPSALLEAMGPILDPAHRLLDPTRPAMVAGRDCLALLSPFPTLVGEFVEACRHEDHKALADRPPSELFCLCQAIFQQEPRLRAWCAWQAARQGAARAGLGPLVEALDLGRITPGALREAFETDYCRGWVNAVVDQEEVIRTFVSAEHEQRISAFRALDDRFTQLTRAWVRARLCAGIPHPDQIPRNSGWGDLRHEMNKKKRHLPIRTLLNKAHAAVTHLAPCLLMSPLSIAQYLAADTAPFDVVVFDEASQIPIWDALGAMARGRQVVMVGDPKQLPPTNFFNRADPDSDDEDVESDLESILDECLGANLPTLDLNWHYRSRHESLIAFSNHHYYGGGLVTFPSPVTRDQALSFHPVAGVYAKGGARVNVAEAKAVVADVIRHLKLRDGRTVGIVTFNSEQQSLIENLLDEARRQHPWLDPHFGDSELEPVFVKNLESVQGDERDIIYFSITYGPDQAGAVSMNFGPMNRAGGERRLNVAITRARWELRVFSSLRSEQINLARTQAIGVRDLRHFLDFAERGQRALTEAAHVHGGYDSPFEEGVAEALRAKGWQVLTQVGVSHFRIDLGVVHPDTPGTFLAGIECDGATYHRSATARDRDKLRESVLRGLGWEILRVWSTDWWVDPRTTLETLHCRLEDLLEASRTQRQTEEVHPALEPEEQHTPDPTAPCESIPDPLGPDPSCSADPDRFFENSYEGALAQMITELIEAEGPIHEERLARLIARRHGWLRTGARIQARVTALATQDHAITREDVGSFFWPMALPTGGTVPLRPAPGALGRALNEISMSELVSMLRAHMAAGLSEPSALVLAARELGLGRLTASIRGRLEQAIELAAGETA